MGDVGQGAWEEIDFTPRSSPGLENYGWDVYEGHALFEDKQPSGSGRSSRPVHVYGHSEGCSVTGRLRLPRDEDAEPARPLLLRRLLQRHDLVARAERGGKATDVRRETTVPQLSSFGEDAAGELYATSLTGRLYRIVGA